MKALTERALQLHLAVVAALAGLGVVITAQSEEEALEFSDAIVVETMCQGIRDGANTSRFRFPFHSGGSITIAIRESPEEWPLQARLNT